jgi:glutaredoxin
MEVKHIPGKNKGKVMLYTLSTCGWCQKTKRFLDKLGVEYYYMDVDILEGKDMNFALEKVRHWNQACTFPTLVINDEECIVGYNEAKMKKALNIT